MYVNKYPVLLFYNNKIDLIFFIKSPLKLRSAPGLRLYMFVPSIFYYLTA